MYAVLCVPMETLEELLSEDTTAVPGLSQQSHFSGSAGLGQGNPLVSSTMDKQWRGGCHSPQGGTQGEKCCYLIKGT